MTVYKFTTIDRTLEFIKPLVLEGNYIVSVRTFYQDFPRETHIDHYEVMIREIDEEKGDWTVRNKEPL